MNHVDFRERFDRLVEDARRTHAQARREYSEDDNVFSNFERLAVALRRNPRLKDVRREDVLVTYLAKHFDSIVSGTSLREGMRGRIIDVVVYCAILEAMLSESDNEGFPQAPTASQTELFDSRP